MRKGKRGTGTRARLRVEGGLGRIDHVRRGEVGGRGGREVGGERGGAYMHG